MFDPLAFSANTVMGGALTECSCSCLCTGSGGGSGSGGGGGNQEL